MAGGKTYQVTQVDPSNPYTKGMVYQVVQVDPSSPHTKGMVYQVVIVGGGVTPTGTKNITSNGVYDVTDFASVDVQVPTTAPALYREFQLNSTGTLVPNTTTSHIMNFTGVTDVQDYMLINAYAQNKAISGVVDMSSLTTLSGNSACMYMFTACAGIISINLSGLTTISGPSACNYMFGGCTKLTSADLSSLTTISGLSACSYMFHACTKLTSVNLSALTTLSGGNACGYMFNGCTGITSIDLSSLTTIQAINACQYMFRNCTGLISVNLSGLTTISGSGACKFMFRGCTSLATVYIGGTTAIDFGTQTDQFDNMFYDCTQNIDVYAPAANQAKIESFSGYPNFNGTGTVTWHWRS